MYRLTIDGAFFVIVLNSDTSQESFRSLAWSTNYDIQDYAIRFFSLVPRKSNHYNIADLLDENGDAFADLDALKTWINDNELGKDSGGSTSTTTSEITTSNGSEDATSTAAPTAVSANTPTLVSNNSNGLFTQLAEGLTGALRDGVNNRYNFSELKVGDAIIFNLNYALTTTSASTEVYFTINGGTVAVPVFTRTIGSKYYKRNGVYANESVMGTFIIQSETTLNGFAQIGIVSDALCTFTTLGLQTFIFRS